MARNPGTTSNGGSFDDATIEAVWRRGTAVPGSDSFRKDTCGALMQRNRYGQTTQWGWEVDHKIPVAKGGTDYIENLQPLQWENNRHKADNYPDWNCRVRA